MPKEEGILGFRYLKAFILIMLAKQGWGLQTATDSLVYRVFKACYSPKGEFLSAKLGSHPSYTWRSIMAMQSLIQQGYRWQVGNGLSLNILKDKWLHKPTTFNVISKPMIVPLDARVSLLIDPYTRSWKLAMIKEIFLADDIEYVGKTGFASHTKPTVEAIQESTSFMRENM